MDANTVFKNVIVAAVFLGLIALAALGLRPGSVSTLGQGSGYQGSGYGSGWNGGEHDDD